MNTVFQNLTQEERKEFEDIINQDDIILHNWIVDKYVDSLW